MKNKIMLILVFSLLVFGFSGKFFSPVANPAGTNVIITEVLYDAPNSDATEEWVELFNPTASAINLAGWSLSDNAGTFSLSGSIAAGGYVVIARDAAAFQSLYGFAPDISGSNLALSNSGDQLSLKDGNGVEVDFVAWEGYVAGWTVSAKDTTIRRITATDTDSNADWENSGTLGDPGSGSYGGGTGGDTTAPSVTITNPTNGATVSGSVTITFSASDANGISSTSLLIDGTQVSSSTSFVWDTTLETDGSHQITARATDTSGNVGEDIISVTVSNNGGGSPPPTATGAYKIMLYNIEQSGINPDWKQVVKEENPDIAIFIETGDWDDNNNQLLNQYVTEFNNYFVNEAPYVGYTTQGIAFSTSGEAILSRYPVVSVTQITNVTLDTGAVFDPSHDFFDVVVDINGVHTHVIAAHLKCCSGTTNEDKRERAMEGIINYMDSLGDVPIVFAGDLNSFSPVDVEDPNLAPNGNLGWGPMTMLVRPSDPTYGQYSSTVHTFTDVFRSLNPTDPGYTYGHQNPTYTSRIDFIVVNQHFAGLLINSTTGDTPTANTGSDHYSVDTFVKPFGGSDTIPPAQVVGVSATTVSPSQIDLTWTANTEPDLAHYNVYRDGVLVGTSTTASFSDTGLTASTAYTYEVSAVDTSGNEGMKSTAVSATTQSPDLTPPAQVTGLVANAVGETKVDLTWTANTEPDLDHYNVYRDGVLVGTSTTASFSDIGLVAKTTYTYEVSAVDVSGNEGQKSTPATVTTPDLTPPAQVTGLTANAVGETQVDLTWSANTEPDLDHYNIYRDGVLVGTSTTTSFSDTGLVAKTTYTYEVSAVDTVGNEGQKSVPVSVTTPDLTPPAQVIGLSATAVSPSQIDLTWTANTEPDLAHYNVYRDGVLVGTSTTASFSDTGLTASTAYTYEISAVDTSGNEGARSVAVTATTPAPSLNHILISEVFYDTPGRDRIEEWVELYNPTGAAVDLSGWTLSDNSKTYTIPSGTVIGAGSFLIIARNANGFNSLYGFMPDISGMNLALGNKGDMLSLKDSSGQQIDFVAWENYVSGWNIAASRGNSIARTSLNSDTDTVSDWQVVGNNGTPGTGPVTVAIVLSKKKY